MYPQPIEDADRDRVIAQLQRQHASGYLDQTELATRTETALRTGDARQLEQLLADLPGVAGYSWTPQAGQQLMPYQGSDSANPSAAWQGEQEPVWRTFLRNAKPWLIGVGVALLAVWFLFGSNSGSFWWIFWIFIFFIRPAMTTKNERKQRHNPNYPYAGQQLPPINPHYAPPSSPPTVSDSYDSDGRDGEQPGQWAQPPRN